MVMALDPEWQDYGCYFLSLYISPKMMYYSGLQLPTGNSVVAPSDTGEQVLRNTAKEMWSLDCRLLTCKVNGNFVL